MLGVARAILQGRPDYQLETVNCNWAHVGDNKGEMVEVPFNLHFTVDESDEVGLRYRSHTFEDVAEIAEFLLAPLLFPELRRGLAQPVVAEHR
mgnify:FL=1